MRWERERRNDQNRVNRSLVKREIGKCKWLLHRWLPLWAWRDDGNGPRPSCPCSQMPKRPPSHSLFFVVLLLMLHGNNHGLASAACAFVPPHPLRRPAGPAHQLRRAPIMRQRLHHAQDGPGRLHPAAGPGQHPADVRELLLPERLFGQPQDDGPGPVRRRLSEHLGPKLHQGLVQQVLQQWRHRGCGGRRLGQQTQRDHRQHGAQRDEQCKG